MGSQSVSSLYCFSVPQIPFQNASVSSFVGRSLTSIFSPALNLRYTAFEFVMNFLLIILLSCTTFFLRSFSLNGFRSAFSRVSFCFFPTSLCCTSVCQGQLIYLSGLFSKWLFNSTKMASSVVIFTQFRLAVSEGSSTKRSCYQVQLVMFDNSGAFQYHK